MKSEELDKTDRISLLFRSALEQQLGVVMILEGTGLPGIVHTVEELSQCLDPRHFEVHHFPGFGTSPERSDLFLYHYWLNLPRYGDLALFDGSYYYEWARKTMKGKFGKKESRQWLEDIRNFELSLHQNGYLLLKIRIRRNEQDLADELKTDGKMKDRAPLVSKRFKFLLKNHGAYCQALEEIVFQTSLAHAPWFTPPEERGKHVKLFVLDYIIARLEEALNVDSRQAVASYDEAMDLMRKMQKEGAVS